MLKCHGSDQGVEIENMVFLDAGKHRFYFFPLWNCPKDDLISRDKGKYSRGDHEMSDV